MVVVAVAVEAVVLMVGGGYHRFCTPAPHCPIGHCFVPKFGISHPTTHRMPSPQSGAPWVQKPCAKVQGCACMSWEGFQSMEKQICQKADSTLRSSQAVPHPSTNRALCCLTSEVERDPVHSTRYGRRRHESSPKNTPGYMHFTFYALEM